MPPPFRILIVGVGSIGERHLRCFQSTGRCEVSFCETMPERREAVAQRYGATGHAGLEEALAAERFDGAVIAAPAPAHIPVALRLAKEGIHLLIEKPLSLSLEGVDELEEIVRSNSLQAAVAFVFRTLPALRDMKAAIDSGRFGQAVQVVVAAGQHFPFYRPGYREIYYARRELGGGLIQDMLPHSLNAVEWLVGPATRVIADAEHRVLEGVEVEDTVNLMTRHGEVLGSFSLNQHQPPDETRITVVCERGAARWSYQGQRWFSAEEIGGAWKLESEYPAERDGLFVAQANAFLDQLAGTGEARCPLAAGAQTLKTTLAILKSLETRRWEDVG